MPNNYFKFKQFIIYQERCAMKVCTDACLFGASLPNNHNSDTRALDIGCGTGLLSLMFAQNNPNCNIDTIEIDKDAFEQAQINIHNSSWKNNIQIYLADVKIFQPICQYNIIFTNPPFYINDLKSNDSKRNTAMHTSSLNYNDLLITAERLLITDGLLYVLIPFANEKILIDIAKKSQLFPQQITRIKQTTTHNNFRSIICFSRMKYKIIEKEIIIKYSDNSYSTEFIELLKNYYLFL